MDSENKPFEKIPNPYNPYGVKSGHSYYNKGIVEKIKNLFESTPPHKIIFIQGKEGSGKSSTLLQFKKDPLLLGDCYNPIYIDLHHLLSEKRYNHLFNLIEMLKDSLDKYRFPLFVRQLDTIKENTTIKDVANFFKTLESQIAEKTIILLIFDDLDRLFKVENIGEYFSIIGFVKRLSEKPQYRILLSRSGEIPKHIKLTPLGESLQDIIGIKMDIVNNGEFTKLITEPVKGKVTYLPSALNEIMRITGGNLYCQQLICYYIILHLNNQEKETCDKEDVAAAVNLTVKDKRDDFEHFWKNIPYDEKLVLSALLDGDVISVTGSHYLINQDSLLEDIFEPQILNDIITRLSDNDFINKPIHNRCFNAFPFKIPLFAFWIIEKYPFLTVVVENIEPIARERDFNTLGKIIEKIPGDIFPPNFQSTLHCIRQWFGIRSLLDRKRRLDGEKIGNLARLISQIFGLPIKEDSNKGSNNFIVNCEGLHIGNIKEAVFLFQDRLDISTNDIKHFADIIDNKDSIIKPSIFFCFERSEKLKELEEKSYLNMIRVEGNDLKNILFSDRPSQLFKEFSLQRLSVNQISPYQTEGPTVANFYGRHNEIQRIINSPINSFCIIGARRIGKSSLAQRIQSLLDERGADCIYLDLEYPKNPDYDKFLKVLELGFEQCFKQRFHFNSSLDQFVFVVKQLSSTKKRIVIILDEIDELLAFDRGHNYQLMHAFRKLYHERCCQIILSGFEELYNAKRDMKSPLFNFGEIKQLGPLERNDALNLITEPMANMGIAYNEPADRNLILAYTASHPNLIQFFCKKLVEKIAEKPDQKRIIYKDDILKVFNSQYENFIINDFYMIFDDPDNLMKLFSFLCAVNCDSENYFSMGKMNTQLISLGIDLNEGVINSTFQKLKLRFIFKENETGKYTFALSHFPASLKKMHDPALQRSLIERIKNNITDGEQL
ncbi:MAG: ATP-binding protein [Candidatus Aminicenantes bacterium]|nr:ATP-binding protein [Candidatus Aminicenantes bacterium]